MRTLALILVVTIALTCLSLKLVSALPELDTLAAHNIGPRANSIDDPANGPAALAELSELTHEQIQIALDIIKKITELIHTKNGNEALIREVLCQQHPAPV